MNHRAAILLRRKSVLAHPGQAKRAARRARAAWWRVPWQLRAELRRQLTAEVEEVA